MDPASTAITHWNWLLGFAYFGVGFVIHILVWRYFHKLRSVPVLFIVFILPVVSFVLLTQCGPEKYPGLLLHLLLVFNYISVYPALQASSPSIILMEQLYRKKSGLSKYEIIQIFAEQNILGDRIKDLDSGGLIKKERTLYTLTPRGKWIANFFIGYRYLLSLPLGAG